MKQLPEVVNGYIREASKIILWLFVIAAAFIFLLHVIRTTPFAYPLDYGEAPLVDQARRLAAGENIYRADLSTPPYTITNYPPLYPLLLSPFANGSPFQMGRLISALGAAAAAVFLGLIIYTLTTNRLAALAGSALFLAIPYVVHWSGLARVDLLALGLAMAGLFVLVRWPNGRWGLIGCAVLLLAAIFTRQSYALSAPLAALAWLWVQDRRKAFTLAGIIVVGGLVLFGLLTLLTDGGFFFHIVTANVNTFSWDSLADRLLQLGSDLPIALLLGLAALIAGKQRLPGWPLLAGFLVGSLLSALTIGKIGSNVNYFLELSAALSLTLGIILAWSERNVWQYAVAAVLIALQIGLALSATLQVAVDQRLMPRRNDFEAIRRVDQFLAQTDGPILADEYMGLLTLQNRPLYLQPFEMTQLAEADKWNQETLLNDIANQQFPAILIHHFGPFPLFRERWSPEMLAAIDEAYRPTFTMAGTVVYTPQTATEIATITAPAQANTDTALTANVPEAPQQVGQADNLYQPSIAVDNVNPNNMAIIVAAGPAAEFDSLGRDIDLLLYTSEDGGETWSEQTPFSSPRASNTSGAIAFAPIGTLYALGIRDGEITLNSAIRETDYDMVVAGQAGVTRAQVEARPWLQIDPETGTIFLSFDSQTDGIYDTPAFIRSEDGGQSWSATTRPDQRVALADFNDGRATWPDDIQVMFGTGDELALVWVWDAEPWIWPRDVWLATSTDGGLTLSTPQRIGESWGPINATSGNGRYAIITRIGTAEAQQLVLSVSEDNGRTWTNGIANGDVPLYFDPDRAPGISIAPDGTIDVAFYAAETAECGLTVETWRETLQAGWEDDCTYNVYHTFSPDGGQSFSTPLVLNDGGIVGQEFVKIDNRRQGGAPAVASTDEAAWVTWIEAGELYLRHVER